MDKTIEAMTNCPIRIQPFVNELMGCNKPKPEFNIFILFDNSGSTNNSRNHSRMMQQNSDDNGSNNNEQTPIIIIAEAEAVCRLMIKYMRAFNMQNSKIHLIPFSTNFKDIKFCPNTNEELYDDNGC